MCVFALFDPLSLLHLLTKFNQIWRKALKHTLFLKENNHSKQSVSKSLGCELTYFPRGNCSFVCLSYGKVFRGATGGDSTGWAKATTVARQNVTAPGLDEQSWEIK